MIRRRTLIVGPGQRTVGVEAKGSATITAAGAPHPADRPRRRDRSGSLSARREPSVTMAAAGGSGTTRYCKYVRCSFVRCTFLHDIIKCHQTGGCSRARRRMDGSPRLRKCEQPSRGSRSSVRSATHRQELSPTSACRIARRNLLPGNRERTARRARRVRKRGRIRGRRKPAGGRAHCLLRLGRCISSSLRDYRDRRVSLSSAA